MSPGPFLSQQRKPSGRKAYLVMRVALTTDPPHIYDVGIYGEARPTSPTDKRFPMGTVRDVVVRVASAADYETARRQVLEQIDRDYTLQWMKAFLSDGPFSRG